MSEFGEIVAPFKKNCFFTREETEEGLPPVLKSECSKKETYIIATQESDIPCTYALASSSARSEQPVSINGETMYVKPVHYFKAKTFFKKDIKEIENSTDFKNVFELTMMFGNAAFLRKYNKSKRFREVTDNLESKTETLLQTIAPQEHSRKDEENILMEPMFPEKAENVQNPKDIYSIRNIVGFDPYELAEEVASSMRSKEIEVCPLTAAIIERGTINYEKDLDNCIWAVLFDSICKIFQANKKKTLGHLFETEAPMQSAFIKKLIKHFMPPFPSINAKLRMDKQTTDRLLARIIILILIKKNCILEIQKYTPCFFGCPFNSLNKLLTGLGCVKAAALKMSAAPLTYVLTFPKSHPSHKKTVTETSEFVDQNSQATN
ncbi:hypothetical protein NEMIN01_0583 [Nematocida minor]|uniref:uncharacterized protein n=1 Tax=Nematocida minor TaxID=1912983 RepID=UPI0022212250|nr:uncharacterized protein NEMIN01_0583 [Nematocida minor]KAI5189630.1 hypothetical protein NEMIN01_0583 [Nematocida minor]